MHLAVHPPLAALPHSQHTRVGCSTLAAARHQQRRHLRQASAVPPPRSVAAAAVKGVEAFDGAFELDDKQQGTLDELLHSEMFCQQVVRDCKLAEGTEVEWTGELFQPMPWSITSKKGMPPHIEEQYYGKEEYVFINVPPVFMFQAKVFQPPRLCAIYRRTKSPYALESHLQTNDWCL